MNSFAFEGRVQNREYALKVIHETHNHWKKLVEERGTRELEHH